MNNEKNNDKNDLPYQYLDTIARVAETDKSSLHHNYTKIYTRYFDSIKENHLKFLEIGIFQGGSVKMWESYFPNADLHFMDINPSLIQYHSLRSRYHYLDQSNPHELRQFIISTGGEFDIIIDDGGHLMNQQITSFLLLFPTLKSGGIYIIEDLHTSYWTHFGGGGTFSLPKSSPGSTIEFLKQAIDDVNFVGARTGCASFDKASLEVQAKLNMFQKDILSLHFYDSLCIILKR
ncbi:MAG: class I SAM-dependent methyltransferase [Parachlamydiaceae bacterium]|nr:class I SAM-dependent methyltransferase [Parachlamydiaceae bacterium]